MKAGLVILLIVSAISTAAFAEIKDKSYGLQFGVARHSLALSGTNFSGFSSTANSSFAGRAYGIGQFDGSILGVEIGLMMEDRNYNVTATGQTQGASYLVLVWDILARVNFSAFSIGAGGYLSVSTSGYTTTQNGASQTATMSDSGLSATDVGLVGSARLTLPIGEKLSLTADARYMYGTKDLATRNDADAATRELQILAGGQLKF